MTFLLNFSMLMCSLHHSPSDQVQNGRIIVKTYIVFERTFTAQNNVIPAIARVVVASELDRRFNCHIFRSAV